LFFRIGLKVGEIYKTMKRILLIILCILSFSGCGYVLQSMIEDSGPTIIYEYSRSKQIGKATVTETNWFELGGDGNTHWEYKYQKGNQTICTGDCRKK